MCVLFGGRVVLGSPELVWIGGLGVWPPVLAEKCLMVVNHRLSLVAPSHPLSLFAF